MARDEVCFLSVLQAVIVNDASPCLLEFVAHGQNGHGVPHDDAAQERLKTQDWPVLEPIWKAALAL